MFYTEIYDSESGEINVTYDSSTGFAFYNMPSEIHDFKEDLSKQCVVLMGLPAAGKSTFVNSGKVAEFIPNFKGYKILNSDVQLERTQYEAAVRHFNWLKKNATTEAGLAKFSKHAGYINNSMKKIEHPVTWKDWQSLQKKGPKEFYKAYRKSYYASYFDMRDMAKKSDAELFKTKIKTAGNLLVIDTVAAKAEKLIAGRLSKTKAEGFVNTIIYLEVNPELSIQRDAWRGEHEGRSVGDAVIMNYAKMMDRAFNTYKKDGQSDNGVVDRVIHFTWVPQGDSPIKGTWKKQSDMRYGVQRKVRAMKENKKPMSYDEFRATFPSEKEAHDANAMTVSQAAQYEKGKMKQFVAGLVTKYGKESVSVVDYSGMSEPQMIVTVFDKKVSMEVAKEIRKRNKSFRWRKISGMNPQWSGYVFAADFAGV